MAEVPASDRRIRQAVVVIHGIGEQRPMDTLRSFVDAVLDESPGERCPYRNKPDAMNELLETRCLQAPANHKLGRPLTDFYEYYWAHHMRGSKYSHVLAWLSGLLLRAPAAIPPALKPVYLLSWGALLLAAGFWIVGLCMAGTGPAPVLTGLWHQKWIFASGLITLVAQWIGSHFVLGYVADAARYLTPSPDNIEARNKIRSEGIRLLRTLHTCGRYRRIVVVGHSLGSVIGYDIIRNLWVEMRKPAVPYPQKQPELKRFKHVAEAVEDGEGNPSQIEAFQQTQHRLWQELRRVGIPWLVTDFVTLGAPLTHAQVLMADDPAAFGRKKKQYEYPCCPPVPDEEPYYGQQFFISQGNAGAVRTVFVPHHGAPFSCTRWTNLFFPYRRLVLGDLIGGPLKGVFGNGVRDLAVAPSTSRWRDRTLYSHLCYWAGARNTDITSEAGAARRSVLTLRESLRLDFLRGKSAKVVPGLAP